MRRLRGGGKLAGVQAGRRRRSAAWERGEGKGASEIDSWGSCRARALARRARRALSRAVHGGVAVAAVGVALEAAGRVARPRSSSARQQEGEEVVRDALVPAHGEVMAGKAGKASAAALSVASAARSRAGRGKKGIRAILQLPKIPGTKL